MEAIKMKRTKMRFVIYARKSTESEDRQALSIQSQITEMKEIAKREHIHIVDILQESKTAKQPGRPIFNAMIEKFKSGKYDGILCWKIDRLARNSLDAGTVQWLLEKETIKQIKTFDRDYNPEDNVVMASIEFSMASQYIRDLSKNVKRGQAEKIRRGEYPATPPVGYLIDYKTKKILLDEDKWHHIKKAFQVYATGNYTVTKLAEKLSNEGFRSRKDRSVKGSGLHKILTNSIYYGWFRWNEQIYKGIHTPIISKDLYDVVQKTLGKRRHTVERNIHNFVFRGHLRCGECGLKITAETKKGHTYYRCTKSRGVDKCSQRYLREESLIKEIDRHLAKLKIDEEILDLMIESAKATGQNEWDNIRQLEKKHQSLLDNNKFRQDSLIEKFINNTIPEEHYNRKLAELHNEEATIEDNLRSTKENFHNVFEKIEQAATFAKHAKEIFKRGDSEIKKEVVAILSSNIIIKDKKIEEFRLAEPFSYIMEDIKNSKPPRGGKSIFEPAIFPLDKMKTAPAGVAVSLVHGWQESNLRRRFWRPVYYHCTTPACVRYRELRRGRPACPQKRTSTSFPYAEYAFCKTCNAFLIPVSAESFFYYE